MHPARFAELIAPITPQDFFRDVWEQAPLHVAGASDRFASLLGLADVDRLMQAGRGSQRRILRIVPPPDSARASEGYSLAEVAMPRLYEAFLAGDTIVINGAQRLWPPLATYLAGLQDAFGPRINCNLYFTPAGSQGFPFHCDAHDVFALQVAGAKRWWIYQPVYHAPMDVLDHGGWLEAGARNRIEEDEAELIDEITIEQGDFLYVPRGFYHKVVSVEHSPSLHLTLSIHPRFWTEVVQTSVEVACRDHEVLRRTLPVPGAIEAGVAAEDSQALHDQALAALATAELDETVETLAKSRALETRMAPCGHFRDLLRADQIDLATVLERRPGLTGEVHFLGGGVKASLVFGEKRFTGPGPIWPALDYLRDHRQARVGDLPLPEKMGEQSKIVLARRLLREGFLRFAERPAEVAQSSRAPRFDELIAPVGRSAFLDQVYERDSHHFEGARGFGDVLNFDRLDSLCWSVFGSDRDLVEVISSQTEPDRPWVQDLRLDHLYSAFNRGHALRFDEVELVWPAVSVLVADTARALSAEAGAVVVATPDGFPAAPPAWAEHESFLVQLDGSSRWDLFATDHPLPSPSRFRLALHPKASPSLDPSAEPARSVTLTAGDVLYLPRGTYRRHRSVDGASLHLELVVQPITVADLVKTAVDARAHEQLALRRSLAPGFVHDAELRRRIVDQAAALDVAPSGEQIAEAMVAVHKVLNWHRVFPPDGHFAHLARIEELHSGSVLQRRIGLDAGVGGPYGDVVRVVFAEHRIQGPEKVLEALRFIADHEEFAVADLPLPGMDDGSKTTLARKLLVGGLLRFADEGSAR